MYPYQYSTLRNTPYLLAFLYEGQMYNTHHEFTGIASGTSVYLELRTGSRIHHNVNRGVSFKGTGDLQVSIYEGATFTAGTTPANLNAIGVDRRVGALNSSQSKFYINPTSVNLTGATLIARDKLYASGSGSNASGSNEVSDFERVFKANTSYLLQITAVGGTMDASVKITHYESGN